jgi:hypothetical protein
MLDEHHVTGNSVGEALTYLLSNKNVLIEK